MQNLWYQLYLGRIMKQRRLDQCRRDKLRSSEYGFRSAGSKEIFKNLREIVNGLSIHYRYGKFVSSKSENKIVSTDEVVNVG